MKRPTLSLFIEAVFMVEDKRLRDLILNLFEQYRDEKHEETMQMIEVMNKI